MTQKKNEEVQLRKRWLSHIVDQLGIISEELEFAYAKADPSRHHISATLESLTRYIQNDIDMAGLSPQERLRRERDRSRGQ